MKDTQILTDYLYRYYDEIDAKNFYRLIFGKNTLQKKDIYEKGKYNAIAIEVTTERKLSGKSKILRHTITNDLDKIDEIIARDNFCLMSPIRPTCVFSEIFHQSFSNPSNIKG